MSGIEMPFISLKEQIDKLKKGVDRCFIPSIYVHTYKIASIMKDIEKMKLTEKQKEVLNKLDEEAFKQSQRLSHGRCSCKVSKDT